MDRPSKIRAIYTRLLAFYGPQNWWPAESNFEMLVGAVLTQNTNWQNVKKTIDKIRSEGLLTFDGLYSLPVDNLAQLIKSSGYYNLKARRLKNVMHMIAINYDGSLDRLLAGESSVARESLLSVKGIGPETADSILLYAGKHPVFVVDTYTHRIFSRHDLVPDECDYEQLQELFMDYLEPDPDLFNEYHALIVRTAKDFCKKSTPLCEHCPLFEV